MVFTKSKKTISSPESALGRSETRMMEDHVINTHTASANMNPHIRHALNTYNHARIILEYAEMYEASPRLESYDH